MAVTITCKCGNSLHVNDHLAGKQVGCPDCGTLIDVPGPRDTDPGSEAAVTDRLPVSGRAAPNRQTGRRLFALVCAIIGGLTSAGLGLLLIGQTLTAHEKSLEEEAREVRAGTADERLRHYLPPEQAKAILTEHRWQRGYGYLLLAGGVIGFIGGVLSESYRRWSAAALLAAAALVPLLVSVLAPESLRMLFAGATFFVVTFPFLLGIAAAVNIRPLRKTL